MHPSSNEQFCSTPVRPTSNFWVTGGLSGKERGLGLVDDNGMGSRFHQVGLQIFNAWIPGDLPAATDRVKFLKPELHNNMSERDIGAQLARTIRSILDAAGPECGLEVIHTPYHNAKGDHSSSEETRNDIGLYPVTPVTHLSDRDIRKSRLTAKELTEGCYGRRSWYLQSIPGEVKKLGNETCAFVMRPSDPAQPPAQGSEIARSEACSNNPPSSPLQVNSDKDTAPSTRDSVPAASSLPDIRDSEDPFIAKTPSGEGGLAQLGEYMLNLIINQHRLFLYSFYVQWRWARILYFDRAGALVSEPFDWTETTSLLHDFVWKVAHMTPEQLGFDPTASIASESNVATLRSKMQDPSLPVEVQQYVQKAFLCRATQPVDATATHPSNPSDSSTFKSRKPIDPETEPPLDEAPIYEIKVTVVESSDLSPGRVFTDYAESVFGPSSGSESSSSSGGKVTEHTFLVSRPHVVAESLVEWCTRGYIAFDICQERFCFLKDYWRPHVPERSRPEHHVYRHLREHGVPFIATLVCGGDVGGYLAQQTRVQEFLPLWKRPVPRVHYRIVLKEIGLPLAEFSSFTELAGILRDAIAAHRHAWEEAMVLHRDIGIGSILIDSKTRHKILVDWELSRLASELDNGPMEPDRTGTWPFRSALALCYPRKPYRLSDDIESFVHIFQYLVLRFHPTSVQVLRDHLHSYFELCAKVGSFRLGGETKMNYFRRSEWPPFDVTDNHGLQELLNEIASKCHTEFYKNVDVNLMNTQYGLRREVATGRAAQPRTPTDTASPKFDACDVKKGILGHHSCLLKLFQDFSCKFGGKKHDDQLSTRASEELGRAQPLSARGIQDLSKTRTKDNEHLSASLQDVIVSGPSTTATARSNAAGQSTSGTSLDSKKRAHSEDPTAEVAALEEEPLEPVRRSKRLKEMADRT